MKDKDPRFDTTLYNHKKLSDGSMPLIGNGEYKDVLTAVKNGDYEAFYTAETFFIFEPKQRKMITDIINGNII